MDSSLLIELSGGSVQKLTLGDEGVFRTGVVPSEIRSRLRDAKLASFGKQAVAVLKRMSVVGRRLTVGKIAEAISLDLGNHIGLGPQYSSGELLELEDTS